MSFRPILLLAAAGVLLAMLVTTPFGTVRASVSNQTGGTATPTATAAATDTPTATAAPATATATATAAAATATATATAVPATATPTATAAAATATATAAATSAATPTATSPPLAAYPAPVTAASVSRSGHALVFRWKLINQVGVKGYNLYAAKHRLNAHMIRVHAKLSYKKAVPYRAGTPALRVLFRNGGHLTIPVS